MWASAKLWIFFSFHSSPFFSLLCFLSFAYFLLACVAEGLDNLFIQVSAKKYDIFFFIVRTLWIWRLLF
jgi:hypothetical protein